MAIKRDKIKFESVNTLLGAPTEISNEPIEIDVAKIKEFTNHPFKVLDDERMEELIESIKLNGILTPVLVRPIDNGNYEMISGHRRLHASKLAGLKTIPAIIKEMTDDEATIFMVDANVQREEILPSERAFSLKMKMDALRHQGTSRHDVDKLSSEILGQENGMTGRSVQRYIRLTELITELLDLVDNKKISLTIAYEISFLNKDTQSLVLKYIDKITINHIKALKGLDNVTENTILEMITEPVKESGNISFSQKSLDKYFPKELTKKQREQIIINLLEDWKNQQGYSVTNIR